MHVNADRRRADHGEALGTSIKDGIQQRTLCRKRLTQCVERSDAVGTMLKPCTQAGLSFSRPAQVWRAVAVRARLLREAEPAICSRGAISRWIRRALPLAVSLLQRSV